MSTLPMLKSLIKENRVRKENHAKVNIYEILSGMIAIAYANYYQKLRMLFALFDFDEDHSMNQAELAIMTGCFCLGWSRFTGIKMPSISMLEQYGEQIYKAAESTPDGKLSLQE